MSELWQGYQTFSLGYEWYAGIAGVIAFFVILFGTRWRHKPFWHRFWTAFMDAIHWLPLFDKPTYQTEEEDEKKRLAKRDARKPGQVTDFE